MLGDPFQYFTFLLTLGYLPSAAIFTVPYVTCEVMLSILAYYFTMYSDSRQTYISIPGSRVCDCHCDRRYVG